MLAFFWSVADCNRHGCAVQWDALCKYPNHKKTHTKENKKKRNGINAKMRFLAQTKGRREKERERKRKGKEEEGKEKGKGEREREIGSEALAETEKIANAPAGNRTRNPSKRG